MATRKKTVVESVEDASAMKERLLKLLLENTLEPEKPRLFSKKPVPEIAERLQSVMDKSEFGCQAAHVAEAFSAIASAIAGEKIEIRRKESSSRLPWRNHSVIVPLMNTNNHNYTLGKPILAKNTSTCCIRMSGENGNNMQRDPEAWRYATKEEVETFILGAEITGGLNTILKIVEPK